MDIYQVTLTFTEPILGTVSLNKEMYAEYIQSKAPAPSEASDEIETIEELTEKGTTGFHRENGQPILYNYAIKGFFKDACGMLRRDSDSGSAKLTSFKKVIDGLIFIEPRRIPINVVGPIEFLERPLRAQTAQGERIALARSEMIGIGSTISFKVLCIASVRESLLREWLQYGALRGLGQWRNADYGRFSYTMEKA